MTSKELGETTKAEGQRRKWNLLSAEELRAMLSYIAMYTEGGNDAPGPEDAAALAAIEKLGTAESVWYLVQE